MLSNLSSTPPWPGSMFPVSFIPAFLLNMDSIKSPNIELTQIITDRIIHSTVSKRVKYFEMKIAPITENKILPNAPSQLFLGDILSINFRLPNFTPIKYPPVSDSQTSMKLESIISYLKLPFWNAIKFVSENGKATYKMARNVLAVDLKALFSF